VLSTSSKKTTAGWGVVVSICCSYQARIKAKRPIKGLCASAQIGR
jgi:hypothetical protein